MKSRCALETAAIFIVGGGIVLQGMASLNQLIEGAVVAFAGHEDAPTTIAKLVFDALMGVVVVAMVTLVQRMRAPKRSH
jgi:predicted DNA repair protein MutK